MKCALITAGWEATRGGETAYRGNCLEKECLWWEEDISTCVIKGMALELRYILQCLNYIKDSMPIARE